MITYSIPNDENGNPRTNVVVSSDGWWIPVDESNSMYQSYLEWKSQNPA